MYELKFKYKNCVFNVHYRWIVSKKVCLFIYLINKILISIKKNKNVKIIMNE